MNTPKLSSILSGMIGHSDPARAGKPADPVHGLDFSQLLGERRSQAVLASKPGSGSGSSPNAASGSPSRPGTPDRRTQAQADSTPAARNTAAGDARDSASRPSPPSRGGASPAGGTAADGASARPSETQSEATGRPVADSSQTVHAPGAAGNEHANPPGGGDARAGGPLPLPATDLAQQAAETGLPALAAGAIVHIAAPQGSMTAGSEAAASPSAAPPSVAPQAAETAPSSAAPRAGETAPSATATTAAAPSPPLEGMSTLFAAKAAGEPEAADNTHPPSGRPAMGAAAPVAATQRPADMPAASVRAGATLPAMASQVSDPAAPATRHAFTAAPAVMAATAPATASSAMAPGLVADIAATAAQPPATVSPATLPPAEEPLIPATAMPADGPGTAAARSLQEFTAMVEAARTTSGTSLPPPASVVQPGIAAVSPAGLAPAGLFTGQPFAPAAPGVPRIAAPLGSPQWPAEFGRRFIHIAQNGGGLGQVAELRLDPPELGPLRITINLNDNVAHAVFSSPHATVRQTVENALPQLQQMLEQAGISLGQANVNDQPQSGQAFQGEARSGNRQANASGGSGGPQAGGAPEGRDGGARPADPNALVDTFA
ncbi:flagellar hook-length control protein FliK [Alcaligenaceae bacterium]|nr:flagellar hook-length control protein FliK [Alcaligenaceae bacterium]